MRAQFAVTIGGCRCGHRSRKGKLIHNPRLEACVFKCPIFNLWEQPNSWWKIEQIVLNSVQRMTELRKSGMVPMIDVGLLGIFCQLFEDAGRSFDYKPCSRYAKIRVTEDRSQWQFMGPLHSSDSVQKKPKREQRWHVRQRGEMFHITIILFVPLSVFRSSDVLAPPIGWGKDYWLNSVSAGVDSRPFDSTILNHLVQFISEDIYCDPSYTTSHWEQCVRSKSRRVLISEYVMIWLR